MDDWSVSQSSKMAACMEYFPRRGEGNDRDGVVLAKFSHGQLNVTSESSNSQLPKFKYYRHKDQGDLRRKNQRIMVAETESMSYVGQNYGVHAPRHTSHCKYLVGVLDKESGKMKVYDTQSFHLRPWLGESQEEIIDGAGKEELTFLEKSDRLTEAFGSAQKQRALESRLRRAVTAQTLETLANKALDHAQSQPQTPAIAAEFSSIIPPCNKRATRLKDVYNVDDIISPSCMEMLKTVSVTAAFVEATDNVISEWRKHRKYCVYILDHLTNLPKESEDRMRRACILVYMHYLRKMYSLPMKLLRPKNVVIADDLPDSLTQHLLDTYTQMSASVGVIQMQRCFPRRLRDKTLLHLLTLALLIDEFKTDLVKLQKGISATMQMFPLYTVQCHHFCVNPWWQYLKKANGNRKFRSHAKALGCKVKTTSAAANPRTGQKRHVKSEDSVETPSVRKDGAVTAEMCLPSEFTRKFVKGKRK